MSNFKQSGILTIIATYAAIVFVSLFTLWLGPSRVIYGLSSISWGGLLAIFVFDSWGTVIGLFGVVVFYSIVVYATDGPRRHEMSLFLLLSTIAMATLAGLAWDTFLDTNVFLGRTLIAEGASSVAVAGEGAVIVLSAVGVFNLVGSRVWRFGRLSKSLSISWGVLFLSTIGLNLVYVLFMQPIFVPTTQYNWQTHEFSFVLGAAAAIAYVAIRRMPLRSLKRGGDDARSSPGQIGTR